MTLNKIRAAKIPCPAHQKKNSAQLDQKEIRTRRPIVMVPIDLKWKCLQNQSRPMKSNACEREAFDKLHFHAQPHRTKELIRNEGSREQKRGIGNQRVDLTAVSRESICQKRRK